MLHVIDNTFDIELKIIGIYANLFSYVDIMFQMEMFSLNIYFSVLERLF